MVSERLVPMPETRIDGAQDAVASLRILIAVQEATVAHMRELRAHRDVALGQELLRNLRSTLASLVKDQARARNKG